MMLSFLPTFCLVAYTTNAFTWRSPISRISALKNTLNFNIVSRDSVKNELNESDDKLDALKKDKIMNMNVEELQAKWIDLCIEKSISYDMTSFSVLNALPLVCRSDVHVVLTNKTLELQSMIGSANVQDTYITEQELRRLWSEAGENLMGKPMSAFNIQEALLLIDVDEDNACLDVQFDEDFGQSSQIILPNKSKGSKSTTTTKGLTLLSTKDLENPELIITEMELQRLWKERADIKWGLPSKEYNVLHALLLVDNDDDEDDNVDYVNAGQILALPDEMKDIVQLPYNDVVKELFQKIVTDLDDLTDSKTAWKKERMALTPDIDTQEFMGDIMQSNSYLTQRIPANWDDPELEEMSDTYLSAGTMAWPGEEEFDYNDQKPIWEVLNLPPDFHPSKQHDLLLQYNNNVNGDMSGSEGGGLEWNPADYEKEDNSLNIDNFFKGISGNSASGSSTDEDDDDDDDNDIDEIDRVSESSDESTRIDNIENLTKGNSRSMVIRNWKTPPDWLSNPQFAQHVGFEVWSQPDAFAHLGVSEDDAWQEEDACIAKSMKFVIDVTDNYLFDHQKQVDLNDDIKYWTRALANAFTEDENEKILCEDIPMYLTPDKDRGVVYGDELIEMKGKLTLHPYQDSPAVNFANDSFVPSEELQAMSPIGTIREVYDWTPTLSPDQWEIDENIVEKIQPIIAFINHAGKLRSTKDHVLIFEYLGQMRHLIGIRDYMISVVKECYPECIDIKLETSRKTDKFDR